MQNNKKQTLNKEKKNKREIKDYKNDYKSKSIDIDETFKNSIRNKYKRRKINNLDI